MSVFWKHRQEIVFFWNISKFSFLPCSESFEARKNRKKLKTKRQETEKTENRKKLLSVINDKKRKSQATVLPRLPSQVITSALKPKKLVFGAILSGMHLYARNQKFKKFFAMQCLTQQHGTDSLLIHCQSRSNKRKLPFACEATVRVVGA